MKNSVLSLFFIFLGTSAVADKVSLYIVQENNSGEAGGNYKRSLVFIRDEKGSEIHSEELQAGHEFFRHVFPKGQIAYKGPLLSLDKNHCTFEEKNLIRSFLAYSGRQWLSAIKCTPEERGRFTYFVVEDGDDRVRDFNNMFCVNRNSLSASASQANPISQSSDLSDASLQDMVNALKKERFRNLAAKIDLVRELERQAQNDIWTASSQYTGYNIGDCDEMLDSIRELRKACYDFFLHKYWNVSTICLKKGSNIKIQYENIPNIVFDELKKQTSEDILPECERFDFIFNEELKGEGEIVPFVFSLSEKYVYSWADPFFKQLEDGLIEGSKSKVQWLTKRIKYFSKNNDSDDPFDVPKMSEKDLDYLEYHVEKLREFLKKDVVGGLLSEGDKQVLKFRENRCNSIKDLCKNNYATTCISHALVDGAQRKFFKQLFSRGPSDEEKAQEDRFGGMFSVRIITPKELKHFVDKQFAGNESASISASISGDAGAAKREDRKKTFINNEFVDAYGVGTTRGTFSNKLKKQQERIKDAHFRVN